TVAIVSAVAFALAVPVVFVMHDKVIAWVVGKGAPAATIWALAVLPALTAVIAVLGFYFMRHLYRIIGTVGEGDPFVPANAQRLSAMGWISVAVHVVAIPMSVISGWVGNITHDMHFNADVPLSGLFLALVLFILARVFREGTRMREDLEGTV
ncbi:MAG: DUF2975 domain-containing protein, partial [Sphingomonadales bacterium]|nr:DUF2975 domain-containing protein [Sphingomonadales bacterium]